MALNVQMVRNSSAIASTQIGLLGQIIMDLGANAIRLHDGNTPGGFLHLQAANNLSEVESAPEALANLGAAPLSNPHFLNALGIGMAPVNVLDITQNQNSASIISLYNATNGTAGRTQFQQTANTASSALYTFCPGYASAGFAVANGTWLRATGGQLAITTDAASAIIFGTDNTEGMRLDGNRQLCVGTPTAHTNYRLTLDGGIDGVSSLYCSDSITTNRDISASNGNIYSGNNFFCAGFGQTGTFNSVGCGATGSFNIFSSGGGFIECIANGSGGVKLDAGQTAWAAISDYRAKDNAGFFHRSGEIIDAIPVHIARYKDQKNVFRPMFFAHEVQEGGAAYAVKGEKDGKEMQTLQSTDPLIPILWEEIRQLRKRIAALEAKNV